MVDWRVVREAIEYGPAGAAPMTWSMPAPPPEYVMSVRTNDGHEYRRGAPDGSMWVGPDGPVHWEWLLYQRGPITAGELAA